MAIIKKFRIKVENKKPIVSLNKISLSYDKDNIDNISFN